MKNDLFCRIPASDLHFNPLSKTFIVGVLGMGLSHEQYFSTHGGIGAPVDWTDRFDRKSVAKNANELIDKLILEMHAAELAIHRKHHLTQKELGLLYRFPIYVATNIFIERLLRVVFQNSIKINSAYPKSYPKHHYFKDTNESVQNYYFDFSINYSLLNNISFILSGPKGPDEKEAIKFPKPQDTLIVDKTFCVIKVAKEVLKAMIKAYIKIAKPDKIGEYSDWMRGILPLSNMMWFDFPLNEYQVNKDVRDGIKECSRKVFIKYIKKILDNTLGQKQQNELSELFADFIDCVLPLTIIEGLDERFSYWKKIIKNWNVKQVHSFVGYFYNENFKIFAILAKRKNAVLIGHQHGVVNFIPSYKHSSNELAFLDIYTTWGKNDCSWFKGDREFSHLRLVSLGSSYLATMKKWRKERIDPDNITLLYPSGRLEAFMSDLETIITPERNYRNRIKVLNFIRAIWEMYPNMRVLYKPFPGTFTNDPIKEFFAAEFKEGKIEVCEERPRKFYDKVDIVLWDSISTGFSESIQSAVPTLVFQSRFEYDLASPQGKEINEQLVKSGIVFYDEESGLKCFDKVVHDLDSFMKSREKAVARFKEATAYPISKGECRRRLREIVLEKE